MSERDESVSSAKKQVNLRDLITRIDENTFEIPAGAREGMLVPARIYSDEELLEPMFAGDAVSQLINVASLPGVVDCVYGMPDMHDGYGFPVGGVAATSLPGGVVSPGGVGFDINCGVRLLSTGVSARTLAGRIEPLVHELSRSIAAGTGRGSGMRFDDDELDRILVEGSDYLVRERGFGIENDVEVTESRGCLQGADPAKVSQRARDRGRDQLGSMGAGNHFVEVQRVDAVIDADSAEIFGIEADELTILIHTGSRGFGHQVCTDYVKLMDESLARNGITLPDRQLACAPASSEEGANYLAAMAAAANFAWANRQLITHRIRAVARRVLGGETGAHVRVVYDVAHNIAKPEVHDGRAVCVHRKGATRAFGPFHRELPPQYAAAGQPVFIPGSMGTASYVMAGMETSLRRSWGSACHGAGRALSRTAARKQVTGAELRKQLEASGIVVRSPSNKGLAEEAPSAYKDVDRVAVIVEKAGLARRVARLVPVGIVKG